LRTFVSNLDGTGRFSFIIEDLAVSDTVDNVADPGWTPDGRLVVTARNGFYLSGADLARLTPVGPTDLANPSAPVVAPDSRTLYFAQERGATGTSLATWALDLETGALRLVATSVIDVFPTAVSPDGRYLAVSDGSPFSVPGIGAFRRRYLVIVPPGAQPL